eukprot:TRINITY_DN5071_c0_g1_i4.p1 TRINITY_DN5071_c0_g1~~TRINITY_DN5071_c0_g1_i4.p1  ORF type:complete len:378 (-),score=137.15 TRINITY_DN5071_c0_g1_i4:353-1486(-)
MVLRWPGCYIPPVPPKKAVGNMDQKFIEDRRRALETFCLSMAKLTHLYYSDEFKIFLRSNTPDIEKALGALPRQSYDDVINKYSNLFHYLSGKEINADLVVKISSFHGFLRRSQLMLENFLGMIQNLYDARRIYNNQYILFINYLMPEFEKNCLSEYVPPGETKTLFNNVSDPNFGEIIENLRDDAPRNPYDCLIEFIKQEIQEVEAFQEALRQKEAYEDFRAKTVEKQKEETLELQKLLSGKSSRRSIFSVKTKEESRLELERDISLINKEVENLTMLCDIFTLIMGYVEIDKFRKERLTSLYLNLSQMGDWERSLCKNITALWDYVLENPTVANVLAEAENDPFRKANSGLGSIGTTLNLSGNIIEQSAQRTDFI